MDDIRSAIDAIRVRLRDDGVLSREDALAILEILERLSKQQERSREIDRDLAARIATIENSRVFRSLRAAGGVASEYTRKAGQALLHSPLHPLYERLRGGGKPDPVYQRWLVREDRSAPLAARDVRISVLMPVHDPPLAWLEAAIKSVLEQTWPHQELSICDDGSGEPVQRCLTEFTRDARVRVVRNERALGISCALNRAADAASGEYFAFLDHDDKLAPHALACLAERAAASAPALIYSDEDRIDEQGQRTSPIFRPKWSPDLLASCMYMGHLLAVSRQAFETAGGFRPECDGAQDYDLALRVSEFGGGVEHISRILYHWRMHAASTASSPSAKPATHEAGRRALADAQRRQGRGAIVEDGPIPNSYRVRTVLESRPAVSVIVCTKDANLIGRCLEALRERTNYQPFEVVVVQHRTGADEFMDKLLAAERVVRASYSGPFNFAAMNNLGVGFATGDILLFLNDDVEPVVADWLTRMVEHAVRPEVGVVGAKLVYPTGAVQHAGIAIGIMDGAGHPWRGMFASSWWPWLDFTRNASAVTGACMGVRREVFEQLHGFDDGFPVNYNDVDLCLRAREAGLRVVVEPAAVLRHAEGRSRGGGTLFDERERFLDRWGASLAAGDPYYSPHLTRTREDTGLGL